VITLGGIARANVIDLVGANSSERDQGGDAEQGRGNEDCAVGDVSAQRAHHCGGYGVSGSREAIIAPDTR